MRVTCVHSREQRTREQKQGRKNKRRARSATQRIRIERDEPGDRTTDFAAGLATVVSRVPQAETMLIFDKRSHRAA